MGFSKTLERLLIGPTDEVPRESLRRFRSLQWIRIASLSLLCAGLIVLHYLTPPTADQMLIHDLHRRLLYIPIILAAFWFGWRGGILCAIMCCVGYFPHIYHDWGSGFVDTNLNRTFESVMYLVVGGMTGYLVDRLGLERKHLQTANEQLAAQSAELERTLDDLKRRTREVFEAEEQLRRADRLKALGQLTTGLAHEIRNPLGSIRGAAEILADDGTPAARRREFGHVLVEETRRLDEVLRHFLEYARAQKPDAPADCELKPVIERLLALLDQKLRAAGIDLALSIPPDLPRPAIAEAPLQQVLLNLMLNAIQAMANSGGRLSIAAQQGGPASVRIAVSDSGPGVSAADRDQIFDPFFTTKPGGTGLGLSIIDKIIANHSGTIRLDTEYSEGARFIIELPAA